MQGQQVREQDTSEIGIGVSDVYASTFPELAVPWEAGEPERPALLVLNDAVARDIGLEPRWLRSESGVRSLLGNELAEGARPVAQAYAGHQFGNYSARLGDGRALLLGERTNALGELRDLHLKGSGPTPFARSDGYAAIGPMLREYVLGEAMHALGIRTTRALAVIDTGRRVRRDAELLPGAVLVRVARSHLRVGTFQYARSMRDEELLSRLVAHALERHYPERQDDDTPALALLDGVIEAQAQLVADWMLVGFIHGVMNTDNVSIAGETIDYGPCAFMDAFEPTTVFSSIDHNGRYSYGNQPGVAQWNLARFAEALLPLLDGDETRAIEIAEDRIGRFAALYESAWLRGMRAKLGISDGEDSRAASTTDSDEAVHRDTELAQTILQDLRDHRLDYTGFFRALADAARGDETAIRAFFTSSADAGSDQRSAAGADAWPRPWTEAWRALEPDADAMDRVNPVYVPRNHLVEEALDAATAGDLAPLTRLVEVLRAPFDVRPDRARFALPAPAGSWIGTTFCGT